MLQPLLRGSIFGVWKSETGLYWKAKCKWRNEICKMKAQAQRKWKRGRFNIANSFLISKVCKSKSSLKHHAILQVLDFCILLDEARVLLLDYIL